MILDFGDHATRDIFHGENSKAARTVPAVLWPVIRRKLDMLNAAHEVGDLKAPPGNRLEALQGDRRGWYSVRVNDQYRVVFQFEHQQARRVRVLDYHRG